MAGSRTLKLSILADVDDLKKKLGQGEQEVKGFGDKLGEFGKKAAVAFSVAAAAAAAYAGKLLIDGVKAAIEDEKAQTALATSLRNVAGASDLVVANVEKYITKTALAVGITDDELRPSFDRLVRSTKDVAEAQKLQALALDIAAGSGKSLETVSQALGRAFDGNAAGLSRLGLGLSAAELKTLTFDEITKQLAATFGGQATEQAETFAGKMERLSIAVDEGKETVGAFVLDAITPLITKFVDEGIPAIAEFADQVGQKLGPVIEKVETFVRDTFIPTFKSIYDFLNATFIPFIRDVFSGVFNGLSAVFSKVGKAIGDNKDELKAFLDAAKPIANYVLNTFAPIFKTVLPIALSAVGSALSIIINAFGKLAGAVTDVVNAIKAIINLVKSNPIVSGLSNIVDRAFGGGKATGGAVNSSQSYLVGERGPELFVPNTGGRIVPNNSMGGQNIVINVNAPSAIDEEGFTRAVVSALNNTGRRTGAGTEQLLL